MEGAAGLSALPLRVVSKDAAAAAAAAAADNDTGFGDPEVGVEVGMP